MGASLDFKTLDAVLGLLDRKDFDEGAHPRDAGGRWSSGEGGKVDHDNLWDDDHAAIKKINARLDQHLGAIHEARQQAAEHVRALQEIQKTVDAHHDKALDALDEHNDILDQYDEGTFDLPTADDGEFNENDTFRDSLGTAIDELKPHVHARMLK